MRVSVVAVVVAVVLAVPATPVAAKTRVKVKGDVVTIIVPVQCVGCADWVAPEGGGDLAEHWASVAEKIWNAAFARLSYCNQYKFEVDLRMENVAPDAASDFGSHRLAVTPPDGSGYRGAGWGGAPEGTPGGPEGQRSTDGTRYYEFDADGTMPADATDTVIAHEFGHVLGLGDDRDAAGNALPGREKTLMVGGADGVTPRTKLRIDKNLVDRIGEQLVNLGKITCGVAWTGTIDGTSSPTGTSAESGCSPSSETGTVQLRVRGKAVSGSITASGSYTCMGITTPTSGTLGIKGRLRENTIDFTVSTIEGLLLPVANCMVGQKLTIPLRKNDGQATFTSVAPSGDTYACTIDISREQQAVG